MNNLSLRTIRVLQVLTGILLPILVILFRKNIPVIIFGVVALGIFNLILQNMAIKKDKKPLSNVTIFVVFGVVAIILIMAVLKIGISSF